MEKRSPTPVRPSSGTQNRPGSASPVASPRAKKPMTTTTDEMLFAQPASVHFGGFALGEPLQQRVRVHNNSAKAVRLRYVFPSGRSGFRVAFASTERAPFISAGLSEELLVTFKSPAGFQYYYDCIQVRCEEVAYASNAAVTRSSATTIPLHAYPTVNEVAFPSRMDFGTVPRGSCARKVLSLSCSVPVAFEFELRVAKAHPAFTVFPLVGVIPARGQTHIEIEFRPLQYATASAELQLHVSQLGFQARTCMLVGSSSSTASNTAAQSEDVIVQSESHPKPPTSPSAQAKKSLHSAGQKRAKTPRSADAGKHKSRRQLQKPEEDEEELEKVRGVEIPRDLSSVTSVSFVLNQEPGKLKPKDLKKAIAANRALRQQQREEQAKLSTGGQGQGQEDEPGVLSFRVLVREEEGFLQRVRVGKQVKDMFFQQELDEVAQAEKVLEFQSHKVHLGQRLLSSEQLAHLSTLREMNALTLARERRERLRSSFSNVAYEPPGVSENQQRANEEDQQPMLGELTTAVLPAHFEPAYVPDFKTYKNDLWARRQRVLQRLVRAVSTCVLRLRAQKRLERIRAWLGGAKTRAQVREKVALDWQRHGQVSGGDDAQAKTLDSSKQRKSRAQKRQEESPSQESNKYLASFPVVEEKSTQKRREAITLPPDWELKFNTFTFMELKPRDEALLMGHEPLPLPALPTYVPLEQGRALRLGASGECGVATSLLFPPAVSKHATAAPSSENDILNVSTPSLLDLLPPDVFIRPQASVRPLVSAQTPRETDASYALRPQRVFRAPPTNFAAWQSTQLGLQSICKSRSGPGLLLSDVFVAQVDKRRAEPLLPSSIPSPGKEGTASGLELFQDAWYVGTATMPTLAEHAGDVPSLSDSESDDDEHSAVVAASPVNWQRAVELFEAPDSEKEADSECAEDNGEGYEAGERLGCTRGLHSFPRYRYLIRQERAYNAHRQELLERLPKRLEEVAAQIQHPDYTLVVDGHGPERPLHQPRTTAA